MAKDPIAFYHLAGIGHWREIVTEQLGLLSRAGFTGKIHIGFLGKEDEIGFIYHVATTYGLAFETRWFGEDFTQYEFPTQEWMHTVSKELDADTPMLYFHGKGVSKNVWQWTMWRWVMNAFNLTRWRDMVEALGTHNCAGFSWVPRGFPVSFFPGTFWWATAGHVAQLTPYPEYRRQFDECLSQKNTMGFSSRHAAECWINSRCNANPKVFGPKESRLWDRVWWLAESSRQWNQIAYEEGH